MATRRLVTFRQSLIEKTRLYAKDEVRHSDRQEVMELIKLYKLWLKYLARVIYEGELGQGQYLIVSSLTRLKYSQGVTSITKL